MENAPRGEGVAQTSPGLEGRGLRLLLAEDNLLNQKLAVRVLEKRGYAVRVAGTGEEALAAWEQEPFDAILMDVHMPEMDGLQATQEIRRRESVSGAHIPVFAMTATLMDEDRDECRLAGMDGAISKPLQYQELEQALAQFGIVAKK